MEMKLFLTKLQLFELSNVGAAAFYNFYIIEYMYGVCVINFSHSFQWIFFKLCI